MMRATVPQEMPRLPDGAARWRRSTHRNGGMFHALDYIGRPVCGSRVVMDVLHSEEAAHLGDMQYWGCCPKCHKMAQQKQ